MATKAKPTTAKPKTTDTKQPEPFTLEEVTMQRDAARAALNKAVALLRDVAKVGSDVDYHMRRLVDEHNEKLTGQKQPPQ